MEPLTFEIHEMPPASCFASSVERKTIPAVFRGCVKNWNGSTRWNPSNNGLDYLLDKVGCNEVEAIFSKSAPVFYGDIRRHERVRIPFSTFIGYCKQRLGILDFVCDANECFDPKEIYLAQVPIMNNDDEEGTPLGILEEDILKPEFLGTKDLASVNLWMNNFPVRSSTHYDPHHNVLCVIAGKKEVVLWPPSSIPCLYPMPIHGEASNHSSVALENPDFSLHPRAKESMQKALRVTLFSGDALFIPEGWYHQVDSEELTIAVNFWWQSEFMLNMVEDMDAYYLRRIIRRLTDKELDQILGKGGSSCKDSLESCCKDSEVSLDDLHPRALGVLQKLVNIVHKVTEFPDQNIPSQLEHDPLSDLLWNLDLSTFRLVLLAMAHSFPRTLETLVQILLSPIAAEVLTRKFDELGKQLTVEERERFFQKFYAAFDDQVQIMDIILSKKEEFSLRAFHNVLDKYLGVVLP